jgi:hypothetical protein
LTTQANQAWLREYKKGAKAPFLLLGDGGCLILQGSSLACGIESCMKR